MKNKFETFKKLRDQFYLINYPDYIGISTADSFNQLVDELPVLDPVPQPNVLVEIFDIYQRTFTGIFDSTPSVIFKEIGFLKTPNETSRFPSVILNEHDIIGWRYVDRAGQIVLPIRIEG